EFQDLALKHDFRIVDARRGVLDIFAELKAGIGEVVGEMMDDQSTSTEVTSSENGIDADIIT
ncbi:MAG TPA: hypothetical protein VHV31_00885, partial [Nitrolancea sp.]|nr:hypothetical protein [Nitrolancea sp.]